MYNCVSELGSLLIMSTTVYGCVETDGSVTFDLSSGDYSCVIQSACIVTSGLNAGQIALTLSSADIGECNDTFYGCVNTTTGKFQVLIPDDCCICCSCDLIDYPEGWSQAITYPINYRVSYSSSCYISLQNGNLNHIPSDLPLDVWWTEIDCPACLYSDDDCLCAFDANETPLYLCVSFSGIKRCSTEALWTEFNQSFWLKQNPTICNCYWETVITLNGENCYIVLDASSGAYDPPYIWIGSATNVYYDSEFAHALVDCGDAGLSLWRLCASQRYVDNPVILAYEGSYSICNPCTCGDIDWLDCI